MSPTAIFMSPLAESPVSPNAISHYEHPLVDPQLPHT